MAVLGRRDNGEPSGKQNVSWNGTGDAMFCKVCAT